MSTLVPKSINVRALSIGVSASGTGTGFVETDGSTPMTANWNFGGFSLLDLAGVANTTPLTVTLNDAVTNAVVDVAVVAHRTSGVAAANFGAALRLDGEDAAGNAEQMARISAIWVNAGNGTESSAIGFGTRDAGGAVSDKMFLGGPGGLSIGTSSLLTTFGLLLGNTYRVRGESTTPGVYVDMLSVDGANDVLLGDAARRTKNAGVHNDSDMTETLSSNTTASVTKGRHEVSTSGGIRTITLPTAADGVKIGDLHIFADADGTFNTNKLTLAPGVGETINGAASNVDITTQWAERGIRKVSATNWRLGQ